jgi:hypothetical protein
MARKTGQIIRRGSSTWLVCIYVGRDPDTRRRKYIGKFIHGGLRIASPLTAGSLSGILDATSAHHGKLLASTSITGSLYVLDRGCGPRASVTTRV